MRAGPAAGRTEPVPDGPHGLDEVRVLLAELRPQAPYMYVDGARTAVVLVAPHTRQQLFTREHLAGMRDEEFQQLVLHVREVEGLPRDRRLIRLEVQQQVAIRRELGRAGPSGA